MKQKTRASRIAASLRALRARDDLTQQQVADRVGVSACSVANYESGASTPSYRVAWKLADLYGVTLDELGGRTCKND